MSQLEPIQFTITLTKDPQVLAQLKKHKMQREDDEGSYFSLQFDAQEFKFRPGVEFTVGKTVGNALIRSSAVYVGDNPLSDPAMPFVVKVKESQLGVADKKPIKKVQFACPICQVDQKNGPKLARHLMDPKAHKEEKEEVEKIEPSDGAEESSDESKLETQE